MPWSRSTARRCAIATLCARIAAVDSPDPRPRLVTAPQGSMTAVRRSFSTWDIPDAAFDSPSNTLYAVTRLHPPSGDALGIVGYDRAGAVVSTLVPLDPEMKPEPTKGQSGNCFEFFCIL